MVSYKPLWHTLIDRDMKKMELVEKVGMSRATLSKLNNNQYVALEVLDRICEVLDCRGNNKGPGRLTPGPPVERLTSCYVSAHLCVSLSAARCLAPAQ